MLNLIYPAHAVGLHRSNLLTEQDEVETGQRLYGRMVGDVVVYLLAGYFAQGFIVTRHKTRLIHKGDVPEGEVADDVMLYRSSIPSPSWTRAESGRWEPSQIPTTAQERLMYLRFFCIFVDYSLFFSSLPAPVPLYLLLVVLNL